MRRTLAHYGLSAALLPVAMISSVGLADDGPGEAVISAPLAAPSEPAASMFTFGGFGTLGVVHSDQPLADFVSSSVEPQGAGHTRNWSAAVDSLLAVQGRAQFTPRLSAVLQVISEQNADSSFSPHVEWAYVKYQFTPDFAVRVGRTDLDVFLLTDSRNIGFANPWVRPPIELYNLVPVTNSDGIDVSYRLAVAGGSNTINASIGHAHYHYPINDSQVTVTSNVTEEFVLVDTFQRGAATFRLNYGQGHLTFPTFDPLFAAFSEFGPQGVGISERYNVDDRILTFFGLGAAYEPGDWFLMAELGRINSNSVLGEATGWYVSSGHRFDRITPYTTYAQVRPNSSIRAPGLDLSALPPSQAPEATALNAGLNAALASIASERTLSFGTRFDVTSSIDVKLQWDHTNLGENSHGWLTNLQPGFRTGSSFNLISLTLDFVF
jgi:hypothetical protein